MSFAPFTPVLNASTLEKDKLTAFFADIMVLVEKAKQLKEEHETAEEETKKAYELVYNHFLYKIQKKCGDLHFYVSEINRFSPFD